MQTKFELYQKVTPLAHLGIWERNLLTGELYWNGVMREIYGVDKDFYPDLEKTYELYADRGAIRKLIDDAVKTSDPQSGEFELIEQQGKIKWVKVRARSGFEDGRCTLLYGTVEDITEQISLFKKLAEREEQFHQAFEFAPIGMALVSTRGGWIRVNKTLSQMLGYENEEFLTRLFQDITHPDDLETDLHQMEQLLAGQIDKYQMDKRYFHKDGSIIWASLHVTLVRDPQGKPMYFVSQIKDITERKKMELERIKTMEIISAQNSRLLNFAHIVSHNLRSHTGNIQMITDMIGNETDPAEKDHLIGLLGINAANLQETLLHLNEVVDVHANSGHSIKKLNLLHEVSKIADVLSAPLKQAEAILTISIAPEMDLDYEQAYLDSILLNLLTNSIKYRDPERQLRINVLTDYVDGKVVLEVNDNGIGINMPLNGHKLFGMYKTFHGNQDARGIGLFLVKNQVEVMGGSISAESIPGQGSTFRIEF